jgi:hypothetical protein
VLCHIEPDSERSHDCRDQPTPPGFPCNHDRCIPAHRHGTGASPRYDGHYGIKSEVEQDPLSWRPALYGNRMIPLRILMEQVDGIMAK